MSFINVFSLLESALEFFVEKMGEVYTLLMADPVTAYPKVWEVIMSVFMGLLGIGFSLITICTYIGIIGSMENMYQSRRPAVIFTVFLATAISGAVMALAPELLLMIVQFGQELISKACGGSLIADFDFTIPGAVYNSVNNLDNLPTLLLWLICLIGAIVIIISTFTILLMAYGRLFKMYIYIGLVPLGVSAFASKSTMRIGLAYLKTFIVTCVGGIVIVLAFMIYGAFLESYDMKLDSPYLATLEEQKEDLMTAGMSESEADTLIESAWTSKMDSVADAGQSIIEEITGKTYDWSVANDPFEVVFSYVVQVCFLFMLLAGTIKSSENEMHKIFGL